MGEPDEREERDLIAHLFGVEREGTGMQALLANRNCTHHLAPKLLPIGRKRGLVKSIYEIMKQLPGVLKADAEHDYFRLCLSNANEGMTLEMGLHSGRVLERFLGLDPSEAPGNYVAVRQDVITQAGFNAVPRGLIATANLYVEMIEACAGRGSGHLTALPTILRRLGYAPEDYELFCRAADPDGGKVYTAAEGLLRGLFGGYARKATSAGACKLTPAAAEFLYAVLRKVADEKGEWLEPKVKIFSDNPEIGPRRGQATRSLSILNGNFIEPHPFVAMAAT